MKKAFLAKLPAATISQKYTLEYGEAVMELHDDAITAGERILLVDDLLATGGTAEAGISLIKRLGGEIIGCSFIVDLPDLGGRAKLEKLGMSVRALCAYEGLYSCCLCLPAIVGKKPKKSYPKAMTDDRLLDMKTIFGFVKNH